jgi:hypothetical protein
MDEFFGKRKPIRAHDGPYKLKRVNTNREAWFYTRAGSIDVCIYHKDVGTDTVRIPLRTLKRIVAALEGK